VTEKSTRPEANQNDSRIEDEIRAVKSGDKYRHLDHVADWYTERCTDIRTQERIRDYNENRDR